MPITAQPDKEVGTFCGDLYSAIVQKNQRNIWRLSFHVEKKIE